MIDDLQFRQLVKDQQFIGSMPELDNYTRLYFKASFKDNFGNTLAYISIEIVQKIGTRA